MTNFKNSKEILTKMETELKAFGLNSNEIKVYKACLELGSSSVTKISQRASIYRTLTYEVLKSLSDKGLVSHVIKDRKKYFEAASPRKFISILQEKEHRIKDILPQMLALQESVKTKPTITLYEGAEGIKTVLENLLIEAKEFVGLSPKESWSKILKYYAPHFFKRRAKAKIKVKIIINGTPFVEKHLEYKITKEKIDSGYLVYNNKIIIYDLTEKNPLAIEIENESFAKSMKLMFDLAWSGLN